MPKSCRVCRHPLRRVIDEALARRETLAEISGKFGLRKSSVHRHKAHIAAALKKVEREEIASAESARAVVLEVVAELRALIPTVKARMNGSSAEFVNAIEALGRNGERLGRITGEISAAPVQNLFVSLGVRGEADIRAALEVARGAESTSIDDWQADGVELLRMVMRREPERRIAILEALSGADGSVNPGEAGNGTRESVSEIQDDEA